MHTLQMPVSKEYSHPLPPRDVVMKAHSPRVRAANCWNMQFMANMQSGVLLDDGFNEWNCCRICCAVVVCVEARHKTKKLKTRCIFIIHTHPLKQRNTHTFMSENMVGYRSIYFYLWNYFRCGECYFVIFNLMTYGSVFGHTKWFSDDSVFCICQKEGIQASFAVRFRWMSFSEHLSFSSKRWYMKSLLSLQ